MASNKIPCGGFYFDPSQFKFVMVDGKPTIQVIVTTTGGDTMIGHFYPVTEDGKSVMDLNLDGHSVRNAGGISTNGSHPIHLGATVFDKGTVGVKLTATNNDELAVVKPDTIDTYVPISVGEPTGNNHATTRKYVEEAIHESEANLIHEIELLKAKVAELELNHPKP